MSQQITTAMVDQFSRNLRIRVQQQGSRLRDCVEIEQTQGEYAFFEQLTKTAAVKRTSRHADTPLVNTGHRKRRATLEDYDWADLVDPLDLNKTLVDPTSKYNVNAGYAMGRAMDEEIIRGALETAYGGRDGTATFPFDTTNNQIAASGTDMTLAKLLAAKEILDSFEVPTEDRYLALTSTQLASLLSDTTITSSDYNTVKALVKGDLDTFVGFMFKRLELLGVDGSGDRRCFAWWRGGVGLGLGKDISGSVDKRPDKNNAQQVYVNGTWGSTRLEEEAVVEILCQES